MNRNKGRHSQASLVYSKLQAKKTTVLHLHAFQSCLILYSCTILSCFILLHNLVFLLYCITLSCLTVQHCLVLSYFTTLSCLVLLHASIVLSYCTTLSCFVLLHNIVMFCYTTQACLILLHNFVLCFCATLSSLFTLSCMSCLISLHLHVFDHLDLPFCTILQYFLHNCLSEQPFLPIFSHNKHVLCML